MEKSPQVFFFFLSFYLVFTRFFLNDFNALWMCFCLSGLHPRFSGMIFFKNYIICICKGLIVKLWSIRFGVGSDGPDCWYSPRCRRKINIQPVSLIIMKPDLFFIYLFRFFFVIEMIINLFMLASLTVPTLYPLTVQSRKPLWNRSKTALKFFWNCSEMALKLL